VGTDGGEMKYLRG